MKLAIVLILLGSFLLIEGSSRITVGLVANNIGLVIGGCLTGIALGGLLLFKGIRRYANKRNIKQEAKKQRTESQK